MELLVRIELTKQYSLPDILAIYLKVFYFVYIDLGFDAV